MNSQWSDEVKERYTKDQAFLAECTARGIQICTDVSTQKWAVRNKPRLDQGADYERGFIDGRLYQVQSSVDKAVNAMSRTWVGLPTVVILDIFAETVKTHGGGSMPDGQIAFAKAIEKALKDRNT
jgi:hypothetical protein